MNKNKTHIAIKIATLIIWITAVLMWIITIIKINHL